MNKQKIIPRPTQFSNKKESIEKINYIQFLNETPSVYHQVHNQQLFSSYRREKKLQRRNFQNVPALTPQPSDFKQEQGKHIQLSVYNSSIMFEAELKKNDLPKLSINQNYFKSKIFNSQQLTPIKGYISDTVQGTNKNSVLNQSQPFNNNLYESVQNIFDVQKFDEFQDIVIRRKRNLSNGQNYQKIGNIQMIKQSYHYQHRKTSLHQFIK